MMGDIPRHSGECIASIRGWRMDPDEALYGNPHDTLTNMFLRSSHILAHVFQSFAHPIDLLRHVTP